MPWNLGAAQHPQALVVLGVFTAALLTCVWFSQRRGGLTLRAIPGVAHLDEAIGRAAEHGRPMLFVPGIEDVQDVQTIYSLMVLEHLAARAAEAGTRVIVPTKNSVVMALAQEAVRQGCARAGRPELAEGSVEYLSDEQFAFCAGVAGIMVREQTKSHVFFGHFYAEALILAETGNASGTLQVAGTADFYQMPYFVASCDATIFGEEYYAVTAAITGDPKLQGAVAAGDVAKVILLAIVVGFAALTLVDSWAAGPLGDFLVACKQFWAVGR